MPDDVRFRMLGPVSLSRGASTIPISAARQRAVLAALLLSPNRFVPRDLLIDQVWNGAPPDGAVKTLQSYVSRLRNLLAGTAAQIVAGHDGRAYQLMVDPAFIDVNAFEELVTQARAALEAGDAERAAAGFAEALSLWQDRPLADLADEYRFADEAALRLQAQRAGAVEGWARAAASTGVLATLADELAATTQAFPQRAGLHEMLLRALVAAGRQADALAAYTRYRALRRDRGLDPEPAIEELHRQILRQDPLLVPAPMAAAPGMIGRNPQLSRLREALAAAVAGRGRCVLIDGEAGVGKTTLAGRLVDEAIAGDVLVASGSPHDTAGPLAFRPWLQVLRAVATAGVTGPALEQARTMLDGGVAPHQNLIREKQFDAVVAALRAAAAQRPLLILLDDMHDADVGSAKLLLDVARLLPGSRVLLLVVARDQAGDGGEAGPGWAGTVERLRRTPGVQTLRPGPLGADEVARLVAFELGREAEPALLAAVTARSGGNPLFVVELTRLLADEQALGKLQETGRLPRVPPVVREAVRDRASLLPGPCHDLVSFAAVLGFEFELAVIRADGEAAGSHLDEHVQTAIEQRFVEAVRPGVLRFCHPLVHEALYEDIPHHRREAWHTRAASAIESAYTGRLDVQAERLAHHWRQVAGAGARGHAYGYAMRASEQAATMLAWEEAARLGQLALDLDDRGDAEHTAQLLLRLARLLARAGELTQAGHRLLEAVKLAPPQRSPDLFVQITLTIAEEATFLATRPQHTDLAVRLLTDALALTGGRDHPLRARLLAGLGGALTWATDGHTVHNRARRDALTREAIEIGRRLGDREVLSRAMHSRVNAIWRPDNPRERYELTTDLVTLAEVHGDQDAMLENRRARFVAALELGEAAPARADARACALAAAELRRVGSLFWANILDTSMHLMTGDFAAAESATGRLVTYSAGMEDQREGHVHTGLAAQTLLYYRERGQLPAPVGTDLSQLERSLLSFQNTNPQLGQTWRLGTANFLLTRGRRSEARELFEEACAVGLDSIPFGAQWLCTVVLAAELCAVLGDVDTADMLKTMLTPYNAQCAVITFGFGCLGSVSHFAGQLAGLLGDLKEAEDLFEAALQANRRLGAPPLVARTQYEYAKALLQNDLQGDRERARSLLSSAASTASRLGMAPLLRDLELLAAAS